MRKELHHIVPRCMGGTDDPSNLIELSSRAHAIITLYQCEHYGYCCLHRRQRKLLPTSLRKRADYWFNAQAKMANSAHVKKLEEDSSYRERYSQSQSEAQKRRYKVASEYLRWVEISRKGQPLAVQAALSDESRNKRKNTFKKTDHQKGSKNSQFGTMWITDGESNKKIKKDDPIPEGYFPGRTLN
jgi:hypothetical protein